MGTLQIIQCAICGKLLLSHGEKICAKCAEQADKDFLVVRDYINRAQTGVDVSDILKNTGVAEKIVLYLMKDGRLSQCGEIKGAALKCAACGAPITRGRLCPKCSAAWSSLAAGSAAQTREKSKTDNRPVDKGNKMYYSRND